MFAFMTTLDTMAPLLGAIPSLVPVYIICLIVGGGLLLISTVFAGDADTGVEGDLSADVDASAEVGADGSADVAGDADAIHGHEAAAVSLASWFSVNFLVYFCAMFGLIGTVLSYLSEASSMKALVYALAGGLVVGQGVHQLLRYLRRTGGDSKVSRRNFVNQPARVTVGIAPGQKGEVAVHIRGRERFVTAAGRHGDDRFGVGDSVGIVAFKGGKAEVVSREEFEFITES